MVTLVTYCDGILIDFIKVKYGIYVGDLVSTKDFIYKVEEIIDTYSRAGKIKTIHINVKWWSNL